MNRFHAIAFRPLRHVLYFCLSLFLIVGLNCLPLISAPIQAAPSATALSPLSTQGSRIVDSQGQTVLLRGANWFGMETETHTPHGLWARDYKEMLQQIRALGYNTIRLPFSVQALRSQNISGVDFNNGSNRDLQGKTPLEVMDLVIQEAERQGLWILLDSHRLNDYRIPQLWYGDGFTEADWIGTWELLARRYRNQANVIGADLKNEPHGSASWGTGDLSTDWRLAAERAGNAIQAINPDWLIVVEGVQNNVPGQQLDHWWGGNLEGVRNHPVRLSQPNKLVYSPHEYGAGVHNQPWFNEPSFPQNLLTRWQIGFHYIADENIAPILIGEFGGRQVDATSKEGIWQRQLVDFIGQNDL
ncbi:MAG: glycoside hydrolase family 5 protein, partial [Cyanobacteria bacterium P01_H01_bin.119]